MSTIPLIKVNKGLGEWVAVPAMRGENGSPGVYYGENPPPDSSYKVWIKTGNPVNYLAELIIDTENEQYGLLRADQMNNLAWYSVTENSSPINWNSIVDPGPYSLALPLTSQNGPKFGNSIFSNTYGHLSIYRIQNNLVQRVIAVHNNSPATFSRSGLITGSNVIWDSWTE